MHDVDIDCFTLTHKKNFENVFVDVIKTSDTDLVARLSQFAIDEVRKSSNVLAVLTEACRQLTNVTAEVLFLDGLDSKSDSYSFVLHDINVDYSEILAETVVIKRYISGFKQIEPNVYNLTVGNVLTDADNNSIKMYFVFSVMPKNNLQLYERQCVKKALRLMHDSVFEYA